MNMCYLSYENNQPYESHDNDLVDPRLKDSQRTSIETGNQPSYREYTLLLKEKSEKDFKGPGIFSQ